MLFLILFYIRILTFFFSFMQVERVYACDAAKLFEIYQLLAAEDKSECRQKLNDSIISILLETKRQKQAKNRCLRKRNFHAAYVESEEIWDRNLWIRLREKKVHTHRLIIWIYKNKERKMQTHTESHGMSFWYCCCYWEFVLFLAAGCWSCFGAVVIALHMCVVVHVRCECGYEKEYINGATTFFLDFTAFHYVIRFIMIIYIIASLSVGGQRFWFGENWFRYRSVASDFPDLFPFSLAHSIDIRCCCGFLRQYAWNFYYLLLFIYFW